MNLIRIPLRLMDHPHWPLLQQLRPRLVLQQVRHKAVQSLATSRTFLEQKQMNKSTKQNGRKVKKTVDHPIFSSAVALLIGVQTNQATFIASRFPDEEAVMISARTQEKNLHEWTWLLRMYNPEFCGGSKFHQSCLLHLLRFRSGKNFSSCVMFFVSSASDWGLQNKRLQLHWADRYFFLQHGKLSQSISHWSTNKIYLCTISFSAPHFIQASAAFAQPSQIMQ